MDKDSENSDGDSIVIDSPALAAGTSLNVPTFDISTPDTDNPSDFEKTPKVEGQPPTLINLSEEWTGSGKKTSFTKFI